MELFIPTVIDDYRVFLNGEQVTGIEEVELPEPTRRVETAEGPGILGGQEIPTNHFDPMELKIKFRGPSAGAFALKAPGVHLLNVRANCVVEDPSTGLENETLVSWMFTVKHKAGGPSGTLKPGTKMDYTMTLTVKRYLCSWMGQDQVEIQPLAGVFKIKGVDVLAGARKMLG